MKSYLSAAALVLLAGCVTVPTAPQYPTDAPASIIDGSYRPEAIARGKEHGYGNFWGIRDKTWNLISSISKEDGKIIRGLLYSNNYSGDWRFWQYAATEDSKRLDVTVIKRDVGSCSRSGCIHYETIMVDLPDPMLEKAEKSGLRLRLWASSGSEMFIHITPEEAAEHNASFGPLLEKYAKK